MNRKAYLYVKAFSEFGSRMDSIALGALMLAETGSPVWLSASLGAATAGGFVASFFTGVLADRLNRRKLMIASDVARAAVILLPLALHSPWAIIAVRLLIGALNSLFDVSYRADVPHIYGSADPLAVNARMSRLSAVSMIAGFLAGGLLYDAYGPVPVLIADALSFLLSASVLLQLRWTRPKAEPTPSKSAEPPSGGEQLQAQGGDGRIRRFRKDYVELGAYLRRHPLLLLVIVLFGIDAFGSGSHNLGIPLLAEKWGGERQALYYGLIWAAWALGNVGSTLAFPRLAWVRRQLPRFYIAATIGMSVGFIGIFMSPTMPLILFSAVVTGIFDACGATGGQTILLQAEDRLRGRVFAAFTLVLQLGFACGFAAAPWLLNYTPLPIMVAAMHGIVITAALVAWATLNLFKRQAWAVPNTGNAKVPEHR